MLAQGNISVEEAEKLLAAVTSEQATPHPSQSGKVPRASGFRYLRVLVEPGPDSEKGDKVNIRVPLNLIRAGLKWASFVPSETRSKINESLKEKGIEMDFDQMTLDAEELIVHLNDLEVEVEGKEKIRVFCE